MDTKNLKNIKLKQFNNLVRARMDYNYISLPKQLSF